MGQAIETEIIAKFHNASQLVTRLSINIILMLTSDFRQARVTMARN